MSKKSMARGAPLPADHLTDKRLYVSLCIPDEPEYRQAFVGHLAQMGKWWFWEKGGGEDRRATQAAELWRRVLYEDLKMGCGCEDKTPTRQRYTTDGYLEVSYDNGETWEDGTDLDPRFNSPIFPPLPGADGEDKKCAAAASVEETLKQDIVNKLDGSQGAADILAIIFGVIAALLSGGTLAPLVMALVYGILNFGVNATKAAFTEQVWEDFRCILYCRMGDDASFTPQQWEDVKSDIVGKFTGIVVTFLKETVNAWGAAGLTNAARTGRVTSADCEECMCGDLNCGFVSNPTTNKFVWTLADTVINPGNFPGSPVMIQTASNNVMFAGGNQTLAAYHEFDEPCYVTSVKLYTLGNPQASKQLVAYKTSSGGAWINIGTRTLPTWSSGNPQTYDINAPVIAVQVQNTTGNVANNHFSTIVVSDPTP